MGRIMGKFENETLYGISINGKKPSIWEEERPNVEKSNLDLNLLKPFYGTYEVVKMSITYEVDEKIL